MEELWESIGADATKMESPVWHGDALRDAELRYETGHEQPVDWATAKGGCANTANEVQYHLAVLHQ